MNKNTLTGLLLMGAVIMLFMWLNKPSQEEIEAQRRAAEANKDQSEKDSAAEPIALDSLTAEQQQNILATIRANGLLNAEGTVYTLSGNGIRLTMANDSMKTLGGEIMVGNTEVPAASVFYNRLDSMSVQTAKAATGKMTDLINDATRYQGLARFRTGSDTAKVVLKNDVLELEIAEHGAVISSAKLLDPRYTRYDSLGQVCPIASGDDMYSFVLDYSDTKLNTAEFYFKPVEQTDTSVYMALTPGDGVEFGILYTLGKGADYTVGMKIVQKNMNSIIQSSIGNISFNWTQKMARNEAGRVFESDNSAIYWMTADGDVNNLNEHADDAKKLDEPVEWVAFKNQFFSTVLVSNAGFNSADLNSVVLKDNEHYIKDMTMSARCEYSVDKEYPASFTFFIGPNSYPLLSDLSETIVPEHDLKLTKLLPLGWSLFRWINTWIVIPIFDFLGRFISNYGIIILLLTLFIKLILFPFTYKSYMSQAKMRILAPEIKEINEKYPGKENAMKRQQETMALYNRAGANPMSGCLPMLLQLPILIAMFRFFPSAIELRGESFLWATDLSAPDSIIHLPFSIPFLGDKLSLFCLLMTAVNIIYTRINFQNQPGGSQMPAMKWMMYLMPVMFLVFFNNYAAGLSYYYLLSLLITIIQTYVFRKIVDEEKVRATMRANAAKPKKKSGFMARLEEAQRKQQAMLREQERQRGKKGGRR